MTGGALAGLVLRPWLWILLPLAIDPWLVLRLRRK